MEPRGRPPVIASALLMLLVGCLLGIAFALPVAQRDQVGAQAAAAQSGTDIAGCASKRTGRVRLLRVPGKSRLGPRRARRCRRSEVAVSWSVSAPVGSQPPAGPAGPQGPQGPQGPADGPAGGALTGQFPNPGLNPAAAILNQSAAPQSGSLHLDGTLRTSGLLRVGSEAGTTRGPGYPGDGGLVVRRTRGGDAAFDAVARVGAATVTIEAADMFFLNNPVGAPTVTYQCVHMQANGALLTTLGARPGGSGHNIMASPSGDTIIFDTVNLRCSFGYLDGGHQTDLVLSRADTSTGVWQGFVISTTNQ